MGCSLRTVTAFFTRTHVSKSKQSRFYVEVYLHGNGAGKGGRETFFLGGVAWAAVR